MKTCRKCMRALPLDYFYVRSTSSDGRTSNCSDCMKAASIDYRNNHLDECRLRSKKWRETNKSKVQKYNKEYNDKTTEERKSKYIQSKNTRVSRTEDEILLDRERLRPSGLKKCYRCKSYKSLEFFRGNRTTPDGLAGDCNICRQKRLIRLAKFEDRNIPLVCVYCGGPFQHVDHVMPKALGGTDSPKNLVPACSSCNLSKGYTHPEIWITSKFPGVDPRSKAREWEVEW